MPSWFTVGEDLKELGKFMFGTLPGWILTAMSAVFLFFLGFAIKVEGDGTADRLRREQAEEDAKYGIKHVYHHNDN